MGEFGATITFVSNIPGETQTLPSAIYTFLQVPGGEIGARAPHARLDRDRDGGADRLGDVRPRGEPAHPRMTLEVAVEKRLGQFELAADFAGAGGGLTAIFGPSGSGKSSLVNLIAGLTRPDRGRITVDGQVLVDTAARIFVPMHRRRIGYVFQDARLFPHLSVRQNLGYGRFFTPRAERYADLDAVVDLLGIGALMGRRPAALSGGERQRVAIGRALVASPQLLLMDEPLASLDEARKAEILPYIERLRDEARIPIVYVSHSVAEVARLASEVVVLTAGRVAATGPVNDILGRLDLFSEDQRDEVGALVALTVVGEDEDFGLTRLRSQGGDWRLPRLGASGRGRAAGPGPRPRRDACSRAAERDQRA